jgi:hypothetical protein
VVLAALLLGSLLLGQQSVILSGVTVLAQIVVGAFVLLLSLPTAFVLWLLETLQIPLIRQSPPVVTPTPGPPAYPGAGEGIGIPNVPFELADLRLVGLIVVWGVVLLALFVFVRLARQRSGKPRRRGRDESESLLMRGDLRRLLRRGLAQAAAGLTGRLSKVHRLIAVARVRQIYAQLLELCEELKRPRPAGQTPLEFLPEVRVLLSEARQEVTLITQAYVKVRYGEYPGTQEEVEAIEAAWERVSAEGRRQKAALKLSELAARELEKAEKKKDISM